MGQLIMAAPDVDRDQFVQEIPRIRQFFRGLTLYASSVDKALGLSMRVAGGIPRAGDIPAKNGAHRVARIGDTRRDRVG